MSTDTGANPKKRKHSICCVEPIAYVGDRQVAWMCIICEAIYHDSDYYQLPKGRFLWEYGTPGLVEEMRGL